MTKQLCLFLVNKKDKTEVIIITIIFYFENVAFFHAKLGLDVMK